MVNSTDFVISGTTLRRYTGSDVDVVIPDGITSISVSAFNSSKASTITVPEGVTVIEDGAFQYLGNLTCVTLPQSLTAVLDYAFRSCKCLSQVRLPEGLTKLGSQVFGFCEKLTDVSVPSTLTEIPEKTFQYCSSLKSIVIPEGVTAIGVEAFQYCRSLETVVLPSTLKTIGNGAFLGCSNLKNIIVGDSVELQGNPFVFCSAMADETGMLILRNVLYHCDSRSEDIVIPQSVTAIAHHAFWECKTIKTVTLPDTITSLSDSAFSQCHELTKVNLSANLTSIGERAFNECKKLKTILIPDSVTEIGARAFFNCTALEKISLPGGIKTISENLFSNCPLKEIQIPNGVTSINSCAFSGCKKLTRVVLPDTLTEIVGGNPWSGIGAFANCDALQTLEYNGSGLKIASGAFGSKLPKGLAKDLDRLVFFMTDSAALEYVVDTRLWESLDMDTRVRLMLTKQSKSLLKVYNGKCHDWGDVAQRITARIDDKTSVKECNAIATVMVSMCSHFSEARVQAMYEKLEPLKNATKAKKTIANCSDLMKKLNIQVKADSSLTGVAKKVAEYMITLGKTQKEMENDLKNFYGITPKDLPALKDSGGKKVDPVVFTWLMTTHETLENIRYGTPDVIAGWEKPGIRPEAAEVLAELSPEVFQNALRTIVKKNLGTSGRSKKMFLAYPICRYADATLMAELTKIAPNWRSTVSGNDAPPLATFRKAVAYSNTKSAMMFADKYHELERYARIRGTDADTIRDQFLSDVGLDAQGGKTYDLGNQVVVARLQKDLSFLVELPTGKTAKSLPKKGADELKYAASTEDFSEMKKNVKKILKNRFQVLFEDFLKGRSRSSKGWKTAYLDNCLLRSAARLLVWTQDNQTFTVSDAGAIRADGSPYTISDSHNIALAHPMDMAGDDLTAWQKYFSAHGLKQPFAQVWEPVADPSTVSEERYKDCMIPYYRFTGQDKHGIHVEDYDFHAQIIITFDDCDVRFRRIDTARHMINPDDRFEITHLSAPKFTRKVNHIVAYLDRITVYDRIRKDDITVSDHLDRFTLAQITEFLRIAQESGAANVTALLLEHKNARFPDFDPMDEFTLEW